MNDVCEQPPVVFRCPRDCFGQRHAYDVTDIRFIFCADDNPKTVPLLDGSPDIDQIPVADCVDTDGNPVTTDQRGVPRPQGTVCDIGAHEFLVPFPGGGQSRVVDEFLSP